MQTENARGFGNSQLSLQVIVFRLKKNPSPFKSADAVKITNHLNTLDQPPLYCHLHLWFKHPPISLPPTPCTCILTKARKCQWMTNSIDAKEFDWICRPSVALRFCSSSANALLLLRPFRFVFLSIWSSMGCEGGFLALSCLSMGSGGCPGGTVRDYGGSGVKGRRCVLVWCCKSSKCWLWL